ncbi:MAG: serine protease [Chloroflexi bacterium]|nr:serine protease [Chloroflexota bacterium]
MRKRIAGSLIVLVTLLLVGCGRAAELIPGDEGDAPTRTATATETPTAGSAPILVTPSLELGGRGSGTAAQVVPDAELARSVVQIQLVVDDPTAAAPSPGRIVRNGSGVVIDLARRLILTSYPLVDPSAADGSVAYDRIVIGATHTVGAEPESQYEAEIVAGDPAVDLAVLRVVRRVGGGALAASAFDLPAVQIGDGSPTGSGDAMRLFGHPGITPEAGSQAVTVTAAQVIGFRGDASITGRAWIKTDARLPFGTQGGPAFDGAGALIGILVQPVFNATAPVAQIRPASLADELVKLAIATGPEGRYRAPLVARDGVTGGADAPWVSTPAFAQNAIDGPFGRDLFDYQRRFVSGSVSVYYEYVGLGIVDGTVVDERVYRDNLLQDQLSSSYPWNMGALGTVTDRIVTPNPAGLPDGRWRLEVWVAGTLRASSTALIGVDPRTPSVTLQEIPFGSTATADRRAATPPLSLSDQLLFFFNYEGMEEASLVFHNGQEIYQSPEVPWNGGPSGRWWIGFRGDGALGAGTWEFELHVDGRVALVAAIVL